MDPIFFETPEGFRAWLAGNHDTADHLWVGFYKKGSGRTSLTWPEAVDEALCYGWIDSIRKSIDAERYANRFTPCKKGSVWSAVNINRIQVLTELGRMQPSGLAAFQARRDDRLGIYSHEQGDIELPEPYLGLLPENPMAWKYYQKQPPSYRKAVNWWVVSAKIMTRPAAGGWTRWSRIRPGRRGSHNSRGRSRRVDAVFRTPRRPRHGGAAVRPVLRLDGWPGIALGTRARRCASRCPLRTIPCPRTGPGLASAVCHARDVRR